MAQVKLQFKYSFFKVIFFLRDYYQFKKCQNAKSCMYKYFFKTIHFSVFTPKQLTKSSEFEEPCTYVGRQT